MKGNRYEIRNDLIQEGHRTVVVYQVWDRQTQQYVGDKQRTVTAARRVVRGLPQWTEDRKEGGDE